MIRFTFAALVVALAQPTVAWSADTPRSRADVKAETRALEKSGQLTPAGEGSPASADANFKSTKTRSERKAETVLAAKHHELQPAGPAGSYKADNALRAQRTSTKTRAERKAETRTAAKEGKLVPAGEGPDAPPR